MDVINGKASKPSESNQITFICLLSGKNYYRRPGLITVIAQGWDRVEKVREGVSGDGSEGDFKEEGLPPCIQT